MKYMGLIGDVRGFFYCGKLGRSLDEVSHGKASYPLVGKVDDEHDHLVNGLYCTV